MAAQWERWLRYAKAKLDDSVKKGDAELDRREAELEARQRDKPWLSSTADAPTLDEARARIEAQAEAAGHRDLPSTGAQLSPDVRPDLTKPGPNAAPAGDTIDMAAQKKAAEERLAAMRAELGLDAPVPPKDGSV